MNKPLKYILVIFGIVCALAGVGLIAASLPQKDKPDGKLPDKQSVASSEDPTEPTPEIPTVSPTEPDVEPDPQPDEATLQALSMMETMTQHDMVCQLLFVNPDSITGVKNTSLAGEITRGALQTYPVGGLIFSSGNLKDRTQVRDMLAGMRQMCAIAPFLGVDEEGGRVARVMSNPNLGTTKLESMFSYREKGAATAKQNAKTVASDLKGLGFNLDFAPVADVWTNNNNTVIGDRAYSDDYKQAAELVAAAVEGFHEGGVACVLKHFPGHGDTEADSHQSLPVVTRTVAELREGEFLPFASGIKAGADMVMVGHLLLRDADPDTPASLSFTVVTDLLRQELGYNGVVITDGITMKALSGYSEADRCVMAVNAGCDMLLGVEDVFSVTRALEAAVKDGTISEERLEEAVLRILVLKIRLGLIPPASNG